MNIPFFHVRTEGELVSLGFNFYPWHLRKYSIGFIFMWRFKSYHYSWLLRYAPYIRKFYCDVDRIRIANEP